MDIPSPLEFLQSVDPEAAERLEGIMRTLHEDEQARRIGYVPEDDGPGHEDDDEDERPRNWVKERG
jgi:hypothetical protein